MSKKIAFRGGVPVIPPVFTGDDGRPCYWKILASTSWDCEATNWQTPSLSISGCGPPDDAMEGVWRVNSTCSRTMTINTCVFCSCAQPSLDPASISLPAALSEADQEVCCPPNTNTCTVCIVAAVASGFAADGVCDSPCDPTGIPIKVNDSGLNGSYAIYNCYDNTFSRNTIISYPGRDEDCPPCQGKNDHGDCVDFGPDTAGNLIQISASGGSPGTLGRITVTVFNGTGPADCDCIGDNLTFYGAADIRCEAGTFTKVISYQRGCPRAHITNGVFTITYTVTVP